MSTLALRALTHAEVVMALVQLPGWCLNEDGAAWAIEKTFDFEQDTQVLLFVNTLAGLSQRINHHPETVLSHGRCVVRWSTHDVQGLSWLDLDAARETDKVCRT